MPSEEMLELCEHGMSKMLCVGPSHYPMDDDMGSMATMGEAHSEWHRNSGVPMGQTCPWDACHPIVDEFDWEPAVTIDASRDYRTCFRCRRVVPIIDGRHGSTKCPQCQEVVA